MKFIITRNYYLLDEVVAQFIGCMLDKKKKEAIYWAYEIHSSGFHEYLFRLFYTIYFDFYYLINPLFLKYILEKEKEYFECPEKNEKIIWWMVANLINKPYTFHSFLCRQITEIFETPFILTEVSLKYFLHVQEVIQVMFYIDATIDAKPVMSNIDRKMEDITQDMEQMSLATLPKTIKIPKKTNTKQVNVVEQLTEELFTNFFTIEEERANALKDYRKYLGKSSFICQKHYLMAKVCSLFVQSMDYDTYKINKRTILIQPNESELIQFQSMIISENRMLMNNNYHGLFRLSRQDETEEIIYDRYFDNLEFYCRRFTPFWKMEEHQPSIQNIEEAIYDYLPPLKDESEMITWKQFIYSHDTLLQKDIHSIATESNESVENVLLLYRVDENQEKEDEEQEESPPDFYSYLDNLGKIEYLYFRPKA